MKYEVAAQQPLSVWYDATVKGKKIRLER